MAPIVQNLNGFGMTVPDIGEGQKFYEAFGLDSSSSDDTLLLGSPGISTDECILNPGREKKLHHVSFRIKPGDSEQFADHLTSLGLKVQESAPELWRRPGLWFQDPWGTWINLEPRLEPVKPELVAHPANTGNQRNRISQDLFLELERDRKPGGLGHILIFTADYERAEKFYEETLGLRTADRSKGKVSFMAAGTGVVNHHCFGLVNATHRGLQHASFSMGGIDDIGFSANRMYASGYRDTFGPGRHAIASNLFQYFRDPWGSWVEYYADMDLITDDWVCRDFEQLPYIWGPEWSPEFWGGEMNANLESP